MDSHTAIVMTDGSTEARVAADAKPYGTDRLDDLDEDVREGRIRRVIFASPADLYNGIWNRDIDLATWLDRGATVEFLDGQPAELRMINESWQRWNRARRGRNAIAGAILSAVALAASFLMHRALCGP